MTTDRPTRCPAFPFLILSCFSCFMHSAHAMHMHMQCTCNASITAPPPNVPYRLPYPSPLALPKGRQHLNSSIDQWGLSLTACLHLQNLRRWLFVRGAFENQSSNLLGGFFFLSLFSICASFCGKGWLAGARTENQKKFSGYGMDGYGGLEVWSTRPCPMSHNIPSLRLV